jgi:alpha-tubulin suppressor-like RCC1 family protein
MVMRRKLFWWALLVGCLSFSVARGAERQVSVSAANAKAKKLFGEGKVLAAVGIWRGAFERACGAEEMNLAKNLGIAYYRLDLPADAYTFFAYARTIHRYGVSQLSNQQKVDRAMLELEKTLKVTHGLLAVEVTPAPNAQACVILGGRLVDGGEAGGGDGECFKTPLARYLPAGEHRLTVTIGDQREVRTVHLEAGERITVKMALGIDSKGNSLRPAAVGLAAGTFHTCALGDDGRLRCWGDNRGGQVGQGNCEWYQLDPATEVTGLPAEVVSIEAGGGHSCTVTSKGQMYCWGRNVNGQIGDGTGGPETQDRYTPVAVRGLPAPVGSAALGYQHSCALLQNGTVYCWGQNFNGQLGQGEVGYQTTFSVVPVAVKGLEDEVQQLVVGGNHSCVLHSGSVSCWGDNRHGQLGDGSDVERGTPNQVTGLLEPAVLLAAGGRHTCAVMESGVVNCWGDNKLGQIGDGSLVTRLEPSPVGGVARDVVALALGQAHTCALLSSGEVDCWGNNAIGQLGTGDYESSATPRRVSLGRVVRIVAGDHHTCILLHGGILDCWGQNYYGQLGDGTRRDGNLPMSPRTR